MGIFRRRVRPVAAAAVTYREPVMPSGARFGVAGWAPLPGFPHPSQQIGAYAGGMLSQFPAMPRGAQLHSGREWGTSRYVTPYAATALTSPQISQQHANTPGAQLVGSQYSGGIGPATAQAFRAAIAEAQVRQSSLSAAPWASPLSSG